MASTSDPSDGSTDTDTTTVENRSEIVFLFDAVDANPNGDPMSAENRPRIDEQTQECIVTDVRLKRYIRDQLDDDGDDVYISKPDGADFAPERQDLFANVLGGDKDDIVSRGADMYEDFLDAATDVRYFGATFSFSIPSTKSSRSDFEQALHEHVPAHLQGPVQFSPGRSLHEVMLNEEYDSLTSVIATDSEKEQGGFGLADKRVKYAFIRFHGIVNENAAEDTNLTTADVERLDRLVWRAMKNQPLARSKLGQEPRLYVRVEYNDEEFHAGDFDRKFGLDENHSKADRELRSVDDLTLDAREFVERVEALQDRIKTVHMVGSNQLSVRLPESEEPGTVSDLVDTLGDIVPVNVIDVYQQG